MTWLTKRSTQKGLNCPMPILKAKKALQGMSTGQTLEIIAT